MSRAVNKRDRFAALRALRASGKKAFDSFEVENSGDVYDEVDENQYREILRERLDEDDFVVDDNGEGYADDGREEWDRVHHYETDSEDERVIKGKDRKSGMLTCPSLLPAPAAALLTRPAQTSGNATRTRPSGMPTIATSASILPKLALPPSPRYVRPGQICAPRLTESSARENRSR